MDDLEEQRHRHACVEALKQQTEWPYGRRFRCRYCKRVSPILVGKEQLDYWKKHHDDRPSNINFRKSY